MLGSVHDADDALQDALLRAWRALDGLRGSGSSLRSWLYRIATNTCLDAIARPRSSRAAGRPRPVERPRRRRRRPADRRRLARPVPGRALRAARVRRARVRRRAAAPARQPAGRAAAVRGARLLRRRDRHVDGHVDRVGEQRPAARPGDRRREGAGRATQQPPADARVREVVAGVLVRARARRRRPPAVACSPTTSPGRCRRCRTGTAGGPRSRDFATTVALRCGSWRHVPTSANGQPAVASYLRRGRRATCTGPGRSTCCTFRGDRVAELTAFIGAEHFVAFGLPVTVS